MKEDHPQCRLDGRRKLDYRQAHKCSGKLQDLFKKIFAVLFITLLNIPILSAQMATGLDPPATPPVLSPASLPIIITEIAAYEASGYEWIEIFNETEGPFDLSGVDFFEDNTSHSLTLNRGDEILSPKSYAVIAQDAEKFLSKYTVFEGTLFDSSWSSLKMDGEEIGLKDKNKNVIELFTYLPAKNSSLKRKGATSDYSAQNWTEDGEVSPGKENFPAEEEKAEVETMPPVPSVDGSEDAISVTENKDAPETTSETAPEAPPVSPPATSPLSITFLPKIFLSEINFQHPSMDWVEIVVADDGNEAKGVDISGYSLFETDKKRYEIPAGTIRKNGEYVVLPIADGLSGGTQVLVLKNLKGESVSAVCWSANPPSQKGVEVVKKLFEAGLWQSLDPLSCPRSEEVKRGWSIGLEESAEPSQALWKIWRHPTPGSTNIFRNAWPQTVINIQSGLTAGEAPLTINVTGENSYDADGDELKFFWNFGDGETEMTPNPSFHTYAQPGNYPITLTVEDSFGATSVTTLSIAASAKINKEPEAQSAELKNADLKAAEKKIEKLEEKLKSLKEKTEDELKDLEKRLKAAEKLLQGTEVKLGKEIQNNKDWKKALKSYFKEEMKALEKSFSKTLSKKLTVLAKSSQKTETKSSSAGKSTKKKVTRIPDGDLSAAITINEIYPTGSDEWIELFNPENRDIRLANWQLDDKDGGSKPYRFADEIIQAEGFLLIQKETSKISLNNDGDEVRLFDFNGHLVDSIAYENSRTAKSYARFFKETGDSLLASLHAVAEAKADEYYWDWTSDMSPEEENPFYETLRGMVKSFMPETKSLLLAGADGKEYQIEFSEKEFNPVLTPLAFEKGTEIVTKVQERGDGRYELRNVESVIAPEKKTKTPLIAWIIGLIAFLIVIHGSMILKSLIEKFKERAFKEKR